MKSFQLLSCTLFFAALTTAGPLRRDGAGKYLPRNAPFSNSTIQAQKDAGGITAITPVNTLNTHSASTLSSTSISPSISHSDVTSITHPQISTSSLSPATSLSPIHSTSTATAPSLSQVSSSHALGSPGSASLSLVPSSVSRGPDSQGLVTTEGSATSSATIHISAASPTIARLNGTASVRSTTTGSSTLNPNSLAGPKSSVTPLSSEIGSTSTILSGGGPSPPAGNTSTSSSSIPRFTLSNTEDIPPPTSSFSLASTGAQSLQPSSSVKSTAFLTVVFTAPSLSPATTVKQTAPSSPAATSHRPQQVTSNTADSISQIPTIIPTTIPIPTSSLSPTDISSNLANAQDYNNIFSGLNFSSPCTTGQIACIDGSVGKCNSAGNFVINVCGAGEQCFALPMTTTKGVYVGCENTDKAKSILGGNITPSTTGPTDTVGNTGPASSLAVATSTTPVLAPSAASQTTIILSSARKPSTTTSQSATFSLVPFLSSNAPSPAPQLPSTTASLPVVPVPTSRSPAQEPKPTQEPAPAPAPAKTVTVLPSGAAAQQSTVTVTLRITETLPASTITVKETVTVPTGAAAVPVSIAIIPVPHNK